MVSDEDERVGRLGLMDEDDDEGDAMQLFAGRTWADGIDERLGGGLGIMGGGSIGDWMAMVP